MYIIPKNNKNKKQIKPNVNMVSTETLPRPSTLLCAKLHQNNCCPLLVSTSLPPPSSSLHPLPPPSSSLDLAGELLSLRSRRDGAGLATVALPVTLLGSAGEWSVEELRSAATVSWERPSEDLHLFGFGLLIALVIVITFGDLMRIVQGEKLLG